MAISSSNDRAFLERIVRESVDCGYISNPYGYRGRRDDLLAVDGCFCCWMGGNNRGDSEVAIIISIVLFALSGIVAAFYALRSGLNAQQAHQDLKKAKKFQRLADIIEKVDEGKASPHSPKASYSPPPSDVYSPETPLPYQRESSYESSEEYAEVLENVNLHKESLYNHAAILLEGRRNERIITCTSQALMALGASLLVVALMITLIAEPSLATVSVGLSGSGIGAFGIMVYGAKACALSNYREQQAASAIVSALDRILI